MVDDIFSSSNIKKYLPNSYSVDKGQIRTALRPFIKAQDVSTADTRR